MEIIWFALLALVLSTYVVLDGFDLGAGMLHLFVAKTEKERQQVLRSIGPVWDGNEVWLLASGGTMFLAFPHLLATALSGFYLPIMLVLWLLFFRGLSIELRHQVHDRMWTALWDALLFLSSGLLIILLGAALGNVVRGVTFEPEGHFFAPLWTHFGVEAPVGALDWYTILVALEAVVVLGLHGALWLGWRTDAEVQERAATLAGRLWWGALGGALVCTAASLFVQPRLLENIGARPSVWIAVAPASALLAIPWLLRHGRRRHAFFASALHIYGLLGAAALSLYPWLLPGTNPETGLTVESAKTGAYSLGIGLVWWLPGMLLVLICQRFVYTRMPEVFSINDDVEH